MHLVFACCGQIEIESGRSLNDFGRKGAQMSKHTRITVETDSLLVLRGRRPLRAWCPECAAEVEMVPLDGVGVISNLPPLEVERWMKSEDLHHVQGDDSAPLVCLNSMLKRIRRTDE